MKEAGNKWLRLIGAAALMIALPALAADPDQSADTDRTANEVEAAKLDAVSRVIESHDPALSVNIGRVYVKQAALTAARDLLRERGAAAGLGRDWNLADPEWQRAEGELLRGVDELIARKVANPVWVKEAWSELVSATLNGEEADEVAVHFQSEGGTYQRRVIEWFVGELTLQTYTFTDRLRYGVPGCEQEMRDLQKATYERAMLDRIYDFTDYPGAMRFASRDPGVKYFKMMVMQGVHSLHTHLEAVATEARQTIRSRVALADAHVARARESKRPG
jgi:hypothetical protein